MGLFTGITFGGNICLSHVLFVDGVMMFSDGSLNVLKKIPKNLDWFFLETGMLINTRKYSLLYSNIENINLNEIRDLLVFLFVFNW